MTSKSLFRIDRIMEQSDWTEKLIASVEKRPALYDKNMKEYADRNVKEKLWQEVCEEVLPNWHDLSWHEKMHKGKDIPRKWQNLRSCFKRELRMQQKPKPGQTRGKRRKYIFYDQLLFLLPTIEDRETMNDPAPSQQNDEDKDSDEYGDDPNENSRSHTNQTNRQSKKNKMSLEESLIRILQQKNNEEIDEDKSFLMSLVPTFKKLSDDQKLQVKMEFLNVLRQVKGSTTVISSGSTSSPATRNVQDVTTSNCDYVHVQPDTPVIYDYFSIDKPIDPKQEYDSNSSSCS